MSELSEYVLEKTSVVNKNIVKTLDSEGGGFEPTIISIPATIKVICYNHYLTVQKMNLGNLNLPSISPKEITFKKEDFEEIEDEVWQTIKYTNVPAILYPDLENICLFGPHPFMVEVSEEKYFPIIKINGQKFIWNYVIDSHFPMLINGCIFPLNRDTIPTGELFIEISGWVQRYQ